MKEAENSTEKKKKREKGGHFWKKAGWNSFLGINSCFFMKWLVFHGTASYIWILDNMLWTSQYFSQVGVICLWEMSISCQLEIFTNSIKSIKGGQGNNGWKNGENKNVKYFFQILELAWAGRKMAKLKLQRKLWPLAGPTLYSYFLFYCDFEFGSIELSIHSIVLACGWYRWIWISETLHAPG